MKIQEKRSLSFKGSEIDRWIRLVKRRKKIKHAREVVRISLATMIAGCFAVLFLMPIILTITNSFMSASEISANYGQVSVVANT